MSRKATAKSSTPSPPPAHELENLLSELRLAAQGVKDAREEAKAAFTESTDQLLQQSEKHASALEEQLGAHKEDLDKSSAKLTDMLQDRKRLADELIARLESSKSQVEATLTQMGGVLDSANQTITELQRQQELWSSRFAELEEQMASREEALNQQFQEQRARWEFGMEGVERRFAANDEKLQDSFVQQSHRIAQIEEYLRTLSRQHDAVEQSGKQTLQRTHALENSTQTLSADARDLKGKMEILLQRKIFGFVPLFK